jgi:hypothetical protein
MNQLVTIDDVVVRVDASGRYCLNDLHKAAIANGKATESQRPGAFLQSDPIQAFIAALDASPVDAILIASVHSVKGGKSQGTYAVELVAIRYAAWIDPAFEVRVYRTFQKAAKTSTDWRKLRSSAASSNKVMNAMLQEVRAAIGKVTEPHHYMTEAKLVNWAHSGQFTGMDRDSLDIAELELLAFLEMKNATLNGRGVAYADRKPLLKQYAMDWRMSLSATHAAALQ